MKMTILRKFNVRNYRSVLALVCVNVLLLSACTTVTTQSFNVSKNTNVEAAQIAVDADFSKYNELIADDMGIFFPQDARRPRATRKNCGKSFARPSCPNYPSTP